MTSHLAPLDLNENPEVRQRVHEIYLSRKRATEDLQDIASLRTNPATDRYLLRRVREVRDGHAEAVLKHDQLTPPEREIRRRLYQAFDEFARIMDTDEAAHRATLPGA